LKKVKGKLKEKGNPSKEGSVIFTFPFCTLLKIKKSLLSLLAFVGIWRVPYFSFLHFSGNH
jgi:hypothetical protein